jgi:hypothetical protein
VGLLGLGRVQAELEDILGTRRRDPRAGSPHPPAELLDTQPAIPWRQVARMRDHLAHRYFDTDHEVIRATVDDDLPELERPAWAMLAALPEDPAQQ